MTSNVKLLPLPDKVEVDKHIPTGVCTRELLFECSPRFYRPTREAYVNNRIAGGEE